MKFRERPKGHRPNVKMPAVAFAGTDDIIAPRAFEKARHCYDASYEVVQVPGGHFMHREHPTEFITELVRTLKDHMPGASDRPLLIFVSDIHLTDILHGNASSKADQLARFWERIQRGARQAAGRAVRRRRSVRSRALAVVVRRAPPAVPRPRTRTAW